MKDGTPKTLPPSVRKRRANHYSALDSVLSVLDAYDGAGRAARRVSLVPEARPAPTHVLRPPLPDGWPTFGGGGRSMMPLPGWSFPDGRGGDMPVVAVALFGLDRAGIGLAVDQVAERQRASRGFVPIFLTDVADHGPFRRRGYLVEYFPPELAGADVRHFRDRFEHVWTKWGASRLIDLSAGGYLEPRIRGLAPTAASPARSDGERRWERPVKAITPVASPDIAALRAESALRGMTGSPDTFVLYRIIGNDLHPRHERGQSLRNVRFILDHEPEFPGCEKRWVVNRIVDGNDEAAILDLLDRAGQSYIHLPFDWDAYAAVQWDYSGFDTPTFHLSDDFGSLSPRLRLRAEARMRRNKINYVINNNGARNVALSDGRGRAKWVLPFDGNCFLSQGAWDDLVGEVTTRPYFKYFTVPMARLTDNTLLLTPGFRPEAIEEPQILFRCDAEESFDEAVPYGRRPKVELFWRLGIPGNWDKSRDDLWDLPRPELATQTAEFGRAGWVARLSSGMSELEASTKQSQAGREIARNEAIIATLDDLDASIIRNHAEADRLMAYDVAALDALAAAPGESLAAGWRSALRDAAKAALARGPYSVVDKTSMPPSGDRHDYWHPAPYWWPNPATLDGLPLVRRDGERVPGTVLYAPESDRYDRTRLQRLFDDTTVLALAWRATGEDTFADHGARLVRTWFIEPETRMNPHMQFAQWRPDQDDADASGYGLIEMKDMYFFLDAVRLLETSGALGASDGEGLRVWLGAYLDWLRTSPQGLAERAAANNHGTCYDLQVAAIAAYVGDVSCLAETFKAAKARILAQFASDGSQPEELRRTQTCHYTSFNLQCWANLARLAAGCGCDLWTYAGPDGQSLAAAFGWLLPLLREPVWSFEQSDPFDTARRMPLEAAAVDANLVGPDGEATLAPLRRWPTVFFPHDGIKPFWLLNHLTGCASRALEVAPRGVSRWSRPDGPVGG